MQHQQGFTLIELLIVMAIIGVLAALLLPNLLASRIKAEDMAIRGYIRHCTTALEAARQAPTMLIPTTIASCQDVALPPSVSRPPYIDSDSITLLDNGDRYDISVISKRGKTYTYNGENLTIQ